jgi:hypothetical protein
MTPISLFLILLVWGYALASFVITDSAKVLFMRHISAAEAPTMLLAPAA